MAAILVLILLYVVVQALLLAISVAVAFFLRWLIPDLSMGAGILVGLLSTVASAYFFARMMRFASTHVLEEIGPNNDEDEDEEEAMSELHIALPPLITRRRRRSRKH